jgi:hypothetical protein
MDKAKFTLGTFSIPFFLQPTVQQIDNVVNVVSTVVVDILNIYCKNRWTVFYLELPRI